MRAIIVSEQPKSLEVQATVNALTLPSIWADVCDATALNSPLGPDETYREIESVFDAYPLTHLAAIVDPALRDVFDAVAAKQKQPIAVMPTPQTLDEAKDVASALPRLIPHNHFDSDPDTAVIEHRGLRLDLTQNDVSFEGKDLCLEQQEYIVLRYLMLNAGRACQRNELIAILYDTPDNSAQENIVKERVYGLNTRFKKAGCDFVIHHGTGSNNGWTFDAQAMRYIDFSCHNFTFWSDRSVEVFGRSLLLSPKESELLLTMLTSVENTCVDNEYLIKSTSIKNKVSLDSTKFELLKKINAARKNEGLDDWKYIQVVRGKGYKFCPTPDRSALASNTPALVLDDAGTSPT